VGGRRHRRTCRQVEQGTDGVPVPATRFGRVTVVCNIPTPNQSSVSTHFRTQPVHSLANAERLISGDRHWLVLPLFRLAPVKLPELEPESAHFGCWISPKDITDLIPVLSRRYYDRFASEFYGDFEDLEQVARLAFWMFLTEKGNPERVRELEALAVVSRAIRDEIEGTRRAPVGSVGSQEIDWRVLTVRTGLTETQEQILESFRMEASKVAKKPCWEAAWLVLACEWEPVEVCKWWRRERDNRRFVSPDRVMKLVAKAEKRIRDRLDPLFVDELNNIATVWW
jgi:hypothetical protein